MTQEQLTEYLERVIRPRMSTVEGVAEIQILGAENTPCASGSTRCGSPRAA